ncbi:MAG TPA: hypothetical protein VL984_12215 [Acidimicrobiales bacterium]|nr:hypothetical protein [Acidimicrobiales bacterium]
MGSKDGRHFAVMCAATGVALGLSAGPAWGSGWPVSLQPPSAAEAHAGAAPGVPGAPAAACTSATSATVKVTWSEVADASTYSVYEATSAATGPYSLAASGVVATSWTSGALSTGDYWFEVAALEGSNWQGANSTATGESTVTNLGLVQICAQT